MKKKEIEEKVNKEIDVNRKLKKKIELEMVVRIDWLEDMKELRIR